MEIYSLQIEKYVLSGIIKYPDVFVNIMPFVKEIDFFDEVHSSIFLVIRSLFEQGVKWDKVILSEKIRNLGISFKNDINIYDYLDDLTFLTVTSQSTIDAAKELVKLRIRRNLSLTAKEMEQFVRLNGNLSLHEIVQGLDAIYGKKADIYTPESQPVDLFEGIIEMIENRGNNPIEEVGLKTPHSEFNRLYGGLKPQQIYAFASRPGHGKTSWLSDLALKTAELNNTKSFFCDTEMSTSDIQWRMAAARANVSPWLLETGNWRKNPELIEKVRSVYNILKEYQQKHYVTHYHIGDRNLDEVISLIRRWHATSIKPGQIGIIVYDYLKLTSGERISENWAEYQVIGDKINRLKRLTEDLNCVGLVAIQLNRTGESFNRKTFADDSSAISLSDRLQWFAAFVAILRRKTVDEIALDNPRFGSHKLIPLKTRFQGRDAAGHNDLIRRVDSNGEVKLVHNFLNYSIENFNIIEKGSLQSIIDAERLQVELGNGSPENSPTL